MFCSFEYWNYWTLRLFPFCFTDKIYISCVLSVSFFLERRTYIENFGRFWRREPGAVKWALKTTKRAEIREKAKLATTEDDSDDDTDRSSSSSGTTVAERAASISEHWRAFLRDAQNGAASSTAAGIAVDPLVPSADRVCCSHCGRLGSLKPCSICKLVRYCGKECQRADWREGGHKQDCKERKE